jgi:hypothetical protein
MTTDNTKDENDSKSFQILQKLPKAIRLFSKNAPENHYMALILSIVSWKNPFNINIRC